MYWIFLLKLLNDSSIRKSSFRNDSVRIKAKKHVKDISLAIKKRKKRKSKLWLIGTENERKKVLPHYYSHFAYIDILCDDSALLQNKSMKLYKIFTECVSVLVAKTIDSQLIHSRPNNLVYFYLYVVCWVEKKNRKIYFYWSLLLFFEII